MRSLEQIVRMNQKAAIAREHFIARALNNPKDQHPRKRTKKVK